MFCYLHLNPVVFAISYKNTLTGSYFGFLRILVVRPCLELSTQSSTELWQCKSSGCCRKHVNVGNWLLWIRVKWTRFVGVVNYKIYISLCKKWTVRLVWIFNLICRPCDGHTQICCRSEIVLPAFSQPLRSFWFHSRVRAFIVTLSFTRTVLSQYLLLMCVLGVTPKILPQCLL
jgi:hypothetical protein